MSTRDFALDRRIFIHAFSLSSLIITRHKNTGSTIQTLGLAS
jgi:hypothetical protein